MYLNEWEKKEKAKKNLLCLSYAVSIRSGYSVELVIIQTKYYYYYYYII